MADVLVALDGSRNGALPVAKRLADLEGVGLRTVQAGEDAKAAETILAAAANGQAGLIVMGAYAEAVRPAAAIGETALAVLRGASCPIVLIDPARALDDWTLGRVLVPHDGSPAVSGALAPAAALARAAAAELVVLQAADADCAEERGAIAPPRYMDQAHHEWPAWSGEFLQRLGTACPLEHVRVRVIVGKGAPAEETLAAARSADLIVLAWRGHWSADGAPILKAVLRAAPCPVMVTRIAAPRTGRGEAHASNSM